MELARPAVQLGTQQGAFILIFFFLRRAATMVFTLFRGCVEYQHIHIP